MQLQEVENLLFNKGKITIGESAVRLVEQSYQFLKAFAHDKIIYGINTGFGPMAQYRIDDESLNKLQYNIIRSHSYGAGEPLTAIYVKAAILARLQTFLRGKSGVHPDVVHILAQFFNEDIIPFIPQHGSVGASGDLVQLAHLALTLIGEGQVFYRGELRNTADVLQQLNISPLKMYIREGLAVTNGTSVMTGIGLVNLIYAKRLLNWAIAASVMMNEVAASYDDFMAPALNSLKDHKGQQAVAEAMRDLSADSRLLRKRQDILYNHCEQKIFDHKVQPFYSLRCVPQVLGPVFDEIKNIEKTLISELNSADDNPIVDEQTRTVYHGGNFHGDYVSLAMDKLKIVITKLTMLCERQLNYLLHDKVNEILPPFLNMGTLGLDYGLQAAQFTATSTTAECQTLSNPMYVHSIPNNNDNQDIVSMGTNSALIARHVIGNAFQVMAIHIVALSQAVDCLGVHQKLSSHSQKIYSDIRNIFPTIVDDKPRYGEMAEVENYLKNKKILRT